jgi:hypothetical protein
VGQLPRRPAVRTIRASCWIDRRRTRETCSGPEMDLMGFRLAINSPLYIWPVARHLQPRWRRSCPWSLCPIWIGYMASPNVTALLSRSCSSRSGLCLGLPVTPPRTPLASGMGSVPPRSPEDLHLRAAAHARRTAGERPDGLSPLSQSPAPGGPRLVHRCERAASRRKDLRMGYADGLRVHGSSP